MFPSPRAVAFVILSGACLLGCVNNGGGGGGTAYVPRDTGPTVTPKDTVQSEPDLTTAPDIVEPDIPKEPEDERPKLACGFNLEQGEVGESLIGAPCEEHTDCLTGFCFDGGYLGWEGGLKFCTIACGGCSGSSYACGDFDVQDGSDPPTAPRYTCLKLTNSCYEDENPVRQFCVPNCQGSVDNCENWFPGSYTTCDYPKVDCMGIVGASKVCFVPEP